MKFFVSLDLLIIVRLVIYKLEEDNFNKKVSYTNIIYIFFWAEYKYKFNGFL